MYIKFEKMNKNPKQFKIKAKFSSLSEEEKRKLLFKVFDILLLKHREEKKKKTNGNTNTLSYLTFDNVSWLFKMKISK